MRWVGEGANYEISGNLIWKTKFGKMKRWETRHNYTLFWSTKISLPFSFYIILTQSRKWWIIKSQPIKPARVHRTQKCNGSRKMWQNQKTKRITRYYQWKDAKDREDTSESKNRIDSKGAININEALNERKLKQNKRNQRESEYAIIFGKLLCGQSLF